MTSHVCSRSSIGVRIAKHYSNAAPGWDWQLSSLLQNGTEAKFGSRVVSAQEVRSICKFRWCNPKKLSAYHKSVLINERLFRPSKNSCQLLARRVIHECQDFIAFFQCGNPAWNDDLAMADNSRDDAVQLKIQILDGNAYGLSAGENLFLH